MLGRSPNTPTVVVITMSALAGALLTAGLLLAQPARADIPRTATCGGVATGMAKPVEAFMNEQLAAGRTNFSLQAGYVCAW